MYLQYICGVFQCAYNIFQCIYSMFQCISMCLNVFINTVIEFHHHFLIVTFLPCIHIYFSLYTMASSPTCYTSTFLFSHSGWSIPTFIQSILTFHVHTSPPHSTFYVVTSCTEHSGAQVIYWAKKFINNMRDVGLHVHYYCLLLDNQYPNSSNLSRIEHNVHY
jgi:hypothetical protein